MTNKPMQWPNVEITVLYDGRGGLSEKKFKDEYEARRFYAQKFKEGKNPKLTARKVTQ